MSEARTGVTAMAGSRVPVLLATCVLVSTATACDDASPPDVPAAPTASSSTMQPSPSSQSVVPTATAPRTQNWVDLKVGDCVAAVPAVERGEVSVTMAECAAPHGAEVYLLAPIAVNTALTDNANRECAAGLSAYVGTPASEFAVTYLIDSRQDRTADNPLPSTVICLLQRSDGQPLTGSARR